MAISPDRYQPTWDGSPQNLGALTRAGSDLGSGFAGGFRGIIGGIGSAIAGIFSPGGLFAPVGEAAQDIRDGMQGILDQIDLIDEILDYGVAYMPTGKQFTNAGRLPFSEQRTPLKGVELKDNGLKLLGKGAWQISVMVRPSWIRIVTSQVVYRINCYDPSGNLWTYQEFIDYSSNETHSVEFGADFVVPEPGYFVAVHVYRVGTGRGHLGGWAATRLVAKRWTSETIAGPVGDASEEKAE